VLKNEEVISMKIIIRKFNKRNDFNDAIACFNEGFEHILWPSLKFAGPGLHRDFLRLFYYLSKDRFVAEVDGEVHGILFGSAPITPVLIIKFILFLIFVLVPKGIFNLYGMNLLAYKHFFALLYGYTPMFLKQPAGRMSGDILLFTSKRKYRSRGMGRRLMDEFMKLSRGKGHHGAYVGTDTALSYLFYPAYGFTEYKTFSQKAYAYSIPGKKFKGIIYYFDFKKEVTRK
jgi:GNAT superfamily N-acetyltransferase